MCDQELMVEQIAQHLSDNLSSRNNPRIGANAIKENMSFTTN